MARACGKVILLGEHAVVYGVPALAVGIELGAFATARPAERSSIRLGNTVSEADDDTDVARAFAALLAELGTPPLQIQVELELPPGCGLGASAAIAVAVARAALEATSSGPAELSLVLGAAMAWERVFHGNPSGVDTAAAASGGCILFTRGEPLVRVEAKVALRLAVAVAGPPASTKTMVEGVARIKERRPELFEKSLDGIHSLVRNAKLCIEAGDTIGLGRLMDLNQMLLSGLFVSTESIERACHLAREAGALGAKLTGAGGGGAVVALVGDDAQPVLDAWRGAGLRCFETVVRAAGGGLESAR
jgi:mevalonate kinase